MKTNPHSTTRSLVLAALFLALAFVLPMITGHVPQVGNMLVLSICARIHAKR